jgi:hypothetical protein
VALTPVSCHHLQLDLTLTLSHAPLQDREYHQSPTDCLIDTQYIAMSENEETGFCDICQCQIPRRSWPSHVAGKAHRRKASLRTQAVLESSHRNRNGVSVSTQETGLDFGVVDPARVSEVVKHFILKLTTVTGEFMVLGPQWTSGSLSVGANTPYVTLALIPVAA